jgi:hypothetical protein
MQLNLRLLALAATAYTTTFGLVSCAVIGRNAKIVGKDLKSLTWFGDDDEKEKNESGLKDLADIQATVTTDSSLLYSEDKIIWADEDPDKPMTGKKGRGTIGMKVTRRPCASRVKMVSQYYYGSRIQTEILQPSL